MLLAVHMVSSSPRQEVDNPHSQSGMAKQVVVPFLPATAHSPVVCMEATGERARNPSEHGLPDGDRAGFHGDGRIEPKFMLVSSRITTTPVSCCVSSIP